MQNFWLKLEKFDATGSMGSPGGTRWQGHLTPGFRGSVGVSEEKLDFLNKASIGKDAHGRAFCGENSLCFILFLISVGRPNSPSYAQKALPPWTSFLQPRTSTSFVSLSAPKMLPDQIWSSIWQPALQGASRKTNFNARMDVILWETLIQYQLRL